MYKIHAVHKLIFTGGVGRQKKNSHTVNPSRGNPSKKRNSSAKLSVCRKLPKLAKNCAFISKNRNIYICINKFICSMALTELPLVQNSVNLFVRKHGVGLKGQQNRLLQHCLGPTCPFLKTGPSFAVFLDTPNK